MPESPDKMKRRQPVQTEKAAFGIRVHARPICKSDNKSAGKIKCQTIFHCIMEAEVRISL